MIKLIVSDIDGTLVKDGTLDINPEYMDVIRKLTEKGIHFVACSGRQYSSEKQLFAPVKDVISIGIPEPSEHRCIRVFRITSVRTGNKIITSRHFLFGHTGHVFPYLI